MLTRYVNMGVAPRKTHSSDWRYPVDFWLGKDGLNRAALEFWFGECRKRGKGADVHSTASPACGSPVRQGDLADD